MVCGLGVDSIDIARVERLLARFGARFVRKIAAPAEMATLSTAAAHTVAARFAAKEAAVKALGTGFAQGITPTQIEVRTLPGGAPQLVLHGAAQARARALGVTHTHISLTHDRHSAVAVVVLEALACC